MSSATVIQDHPTCYPNPSFSVASAVHLRLELCGLLLGPEPVLAHAEVHRGQLHGGRDCQQCGHRECLGRTQQPSQRPTGTVEWRYELPGRLSVLCGSGDTVVLHRVGGVALQSERPAVPAHCIHHQRLLQQATHLLRTEAQRRWLRERHFSSPDNSHRRADPGSIACSRTSEIVVVFSGQLARSGRYRRPRDYVNLGVCGALRLRLLLLQKISSDRASRCLTIAEFICQEQKSG